MNKVEIIKGIETTMKGLDMIREALIEVDTNATVTEVVEEPKKVAPKKEVIKEEVVVVEDTTNTTDGIDIEQLKSMKYNDFKKFAASLGVKCTGTRDEIMQRILDLGTVAEEEVVEEVADEVEEVAEEPKKAKPSKKLGKKKEEVAPKDEFDEQAEEIAKDTPIEDIIEALADVDVKANKNNYITLLAKALREGLIELDDEDEEEVAEEVVEDGSAEDIEADSYFPQFDTEGYNDPKNMTEERAEAIETKMDSILTDISEGKLTEDDITSYIEDNATEDEIELLGEDYDEDDLIKMYMELVKRTIDNDGEEHEPSDPYEVGDKDLCCGHELQYVKKANKYVCSQCGEEYEAE